jgi:hypothetical protein
VFEVVVKMSAGERYVCADMPRELYGWSKQEGPDGQPLALDHAALMVSPGSRIRLRSAASGWA